MTYYPYGIAAAGAMLLMYLLCKFGQAKQKMPSGTAELFAVIALPMMLVVSRLVFCLTSFGYFFETIAQPVKMLNFFDGGYSMTGALLGLVLAALITAKVMKIDFAKLIDMVTTYVAAPIAVLRLAEQFTLLGRGREVQNAFLRSVSFCTIADETGTLCHAVFRYEAVVAVVIFVIMLLISKRDWRAGDKALMFFALYGAAQVVLESMRDDFHMMWGFVRAQQIYAILFIALAIAVFSIRIIKRSKITTELLLLWAVSAAAIGVGIVKEFAVDASHNLFVDYGIMSAALLSLLAVAIRTRAVSSRLE